MSFVSYRITALAGAIAMMAATGATAQQTHTDHAGHAACGMRTMETSLDRATLLENTRRQNPDLYTRIMSRPRERSGLHGAGDLELTFLVRNRVSNVLEEINGALVHDGIYSRVWVDVRDTAKASLKPSGTKMQTLFTALDTKVLQTNTTPRNANQGILKNDIDVFGDIPQENNVENKTDFLLLDIKDAVQGQNVLGYFSPGDQRPGPESNMMNLLYIDSNEGFAQMQTLLAIIAHEFQHLIHFGRHPRIAGDDIARDVALNEGMSEVASILNGYHFRSNASFLNNTNVSFFDWHFDNAMDQEADYQRAMTFAHYLSEHFGERFLYELVGSPLDNMARVSDALRRYGMPESFDYREVLKGFAVANYLQSSSNPSFHYIYKLKAGGARPHSTSSGAGFPPTGSAVVQPYGTYYVQYTSPGPMRFRFSGSSEIKVMLMGMRASDTAVIELQSDTDYDLPLWEGGAYAKVAVAFVNTGGGVREANWAAQGITSSVASETGSTRALRVEGSRDNGDGSAIIAFSLPASAPARLELYSMNGELVRVFIADEIRSAGRHRETIAVDGLPAGAYVARLSQSGVAAATMVRVTH